MKALYKMRESQNGSALMSFEALCHFELCKLLVNLYHLPEAAPQYGCENGLMTFVSLGCWLDSSVFLYESFKHLISLSSAYEKEIKAHPFFKDLEVVRNNIHTYYKKGRYSKKSASITESKLKEYKLDEPDWLYAFRNDVSLIFQIQESSVQLMGSDYFIRHCIFESKKKEWDGLYFQAYGEFLSSEISKLIRNTNLQVFSLRELGLSRQLPRVELFDYKSDFLKEKSKVSWTVSFRLMLILHQISYILLLLEELIRFDIETESSMWIFFFGKLLAIKYDESFDNLQSLLKFSAESDIRVLLENLQAVGLNVNTLYAREFAQKLRNTIHYQRLTINLSMVENNSPKSQVSAVYLSNTETNSITEFKTFSLSMVNELKLLQKAIQGILGVDVSSQSLKN